MTIEIRDGRYVKGFATHEFQAGVAEEGAPKPRYDGNLLSVLYTDDPERRNWIILYRFRYYLDSDMTSSSKDERRWYQIDFEADEEQAWVDYLLWSQTAAAHVKSNLESLRVESDSAETVATALSTLSTAREIKQPTGVGGGYGPN